MNEINDVSLIGNIDASLIKFAEELCAMENQLNYNYNNYTLVIMFLSFGDKFTYKVRGPKCAKSTPFRPASTCS